MYAVYGYLSKYQLIHVTLGPITDYHPYNVHIFVSLTQIARCKLRTLCPKWQLPLMTEDKFNKIIYANYSQEY